ncbi:MAG: DUF362 domain-containing protein [Clostridia bacterium]|nr:DUF362 domain-containing protein [Clostridia bacterium]
MKNIKKIIVYGIIAVLCIAAIAGYAGQKWLKGLGGGSAVVSEAGPGGDKKKMSDIRDLNNNILPQIVWDRMQKNNVISDKNPVIGAGVGKDFSATTREAVKNADALEKLIKKGSTVLIKPNMIKSAAPEQGVETDYRVVQEIANIARELGASRVVVADGSPWGRSFDDTNMYTKLTGVELIDFNDCREEDCYKFTPEKSLTGGEFYMPKIYMEADVVISAAKLKTHFEAVVTLSLKNIFGVPPVQLTGAGQGRDYLHNMGISNSIVDLNKIRKPDFVIIDGIIGGEGNMPFSGTPVDSGVVFAGTDPVAADTVALNFMGFTLDEIEHVRLAGQEGLGINDLSKIKLVGLDLNKSQMFFRRSESY